MFRFDVMARAVNTTAHRGWIFFIINIEIYILRERLCFKGLALKQINIVNQSRLGLAVTFPPTATAIIWAWCGTTALNL